MPETCAVPQQRKILSLGEQNCTGKNATPSHDRTWPRAANIALYRKLISESELDPSRDEDRHETLVYLLAEEMAKDNKPADVRSWCLPCPLTTQGERYETSDYPSTTNRRLRCPDDNGSERRRLCSRCVPSRLRRRRRCCSCRTSCRCRPTCCCCRSAQGRCRSCPPQSLLIVL
jgi:hypothetical protein